MLEILIGNIINNIDIFNIKNTLISNKYLYLLTRVFYNYKKNNYQILKISSYLNLQLSFNEIINLVNFNENDYIHLHQIYKDIVLLGYDNISYKLLKLIKNSYNIPIQNEIISNDMVKTFKYIMKNHENDYSLNYTHFDLITKHNSIKIINHIIKTNIDRYIPEHTDKLKNIAINKFIFLVYQNYHYNNEDKVVKDLRYIINKYNINDNNNLYIRDYNIYNGMNGMNLIEDLYLKSCQNNNFKILKLLFKNNVILSSIYYIKGLIIGSKNNSKEVIQYLITYNKNITINSELNEFIHYVIHKLDIKYIKYIIKRYNVIEDDRVINTIITSNKWEVIKYLIDEYNKKDKKLTQIIKNILINEYCIKFNDYELIEKVIKDDIALEFIDVYKLIYNSDIKMIKLILKYKNKFKFDDKRITHMISFCIKKIKEGKGEYNSILHLLLRI